MAFALDGRNQSRVAMNSAGSIDVIIRALSRYLRVNPLASDTLEGIAHWWLPSMIVGADELELACRWLERAGVIEAARAADGRVHYRRPGLDSAIDARLDRLIAGERA